MASHGKGGIHAALIGSVTDKVVRNAAVPVLIVPLGTRARLTSDPVVVGLDGSEVAEAGLVVARDLAALLRAPLVLVRAYNLPPPAGFEFVAYPVDLATTLRAGSEEYLTQVARPGEESVAIQGPGYDAISRTAERADASLVVVTSHGKGFATRLALGSTTDRLLHGLRRPLLVVPAGYPVAAARELTGAAGASA
jgi:nucleotide-binding universal stress UspA family protein